MKRQMIGQFKTFSPTVIGKRQTDDLNQNFEGIYQILNGILDRLNKIEDKGPQSSFLLGEASTVGSTESGFIEVVIGDKTRYIRLYAKK